MQSAHVDIVRSIFTAWEGGDFSSAEWAHPQIELVFADGPSPGSWTGAAGLAQGAREWLSAWDDCRLEAYDYRELDGERILVFTRFSGRGKTSGLELRQMPTRRAVWLVHVRDGEVTRLIRYWDRERALADLGLALDTGPPGS
jgi:ketosteroid isomerase-like protein